MLMYYRLLCNKYYEMRFYIVTCSYNRQSIVIFSCIVLYTLYNYIYIVVYIYCLLYCVHTCNCTFMKHKIQF